MVVEHKLYFGKYRSLPLLQVPSDYLAWALRTVKLSGGMRQAVAGELSRPTLGG